MMGTNILLGTAGLGESSVIELAKHHPAHIYFSGRNAKSAEGVLEKVREGSPDAKVTFVECNLASLASVKAAADRVLADETRLDVLMCNAGIMAVPAGLTTDGYEMQFGTNHVGHALLIKKLLPLLLRTAETPGADVRIINLTSLGFALHPKGGIQFKDLKTVQDFGTFGPWIRYGQSKLANIWYARELARRYPSILSLSIHPGVVATGLVGNLSFANKAIVYLTSMGKLLKPSEGAFNQLWAVGVSKEKVENGQFYEPVGVLSTRLDKVAKDNDNELATQLWDWTEKELEAY
jgi:NAD(P)-dependent dehydrogenase (short-subunit alcohol dehydrogenase family)